MIRPVIGVVTNLEHDPNYRFPGYPRVTINEDYHRSIAAAGGIPILIPPAEDFAVLDAQLALIDGLILAGGQDIDPALYGQVAESGVEQHSSVRDSFELAVLSRAKETGLPVLAICRGLQILNVWAGGSLHQDLPVTTYSHACTGKPTDRVHQIAIDPGSALRAIAGTDSEEVNSFHHQGVDIVGRGVRVVARANDGVVEAIEMGGSVANPWALAVQWHPEMLSRGDHFSQRLFEWIVGGASHHRQRARRLPKMA